MRTGTDMIHGRDQNGGKDRHDTKPVAHKQVMVQNGDSFNKGLCTEAMEPAPYLPSLWSWPSMGLGVFSLQYMWPEITFQTIISPS